MRLNSTRFISFHEIKVDKVDLYEDAFGLYPEIGDMIEIIPESEVVPEVIVNKLIERIRKK